MKLKIIKGDFSVCKLEDFTKVNLTSSYVFIGKTDEENSLVCMSQEVPSNVIEEDKGWLAFRVEGVLDFSLVGILSQISQLLAEAKISIFAVSTFNTDYILTKAKDFPAAIEVLQKAGYEIID
ncbi:ACT domain-containing protein [Streptococcus suis]|uniref:ACT domain-containing protein n=1 Tax=Streptococcus suis TaxID=1307 RepID=UPI00040CEFD5|nr:ACT domain-containing protein [Streptococcus suis]